MEEFNITLDDFKSKSSLGKCIPSTSVKSKKPSIIPCIPPISDELNSVNLGY